MRPSICFATILLVIAGRPAVAQEAGPRLDALLARAAQGDKAAIHDAETVGWQWIKLMAEQGHLDTAAAHAMVRTMLVLDGVRPPDQAPDGDQRAWRGAAVTGLAMALAQDSADSWSASQLERLAPYPYIWASPAHELQSLRALQRRARREPDELLVTRIRLELECGSVDSGAAALAALPMNSVSPAARGHLLAEVSFAQRKDTAGAVAYYNGAAAIRDSADAAWYQRDLLWIANPAELTEWDALAPGAREAWLEKFWNRRDIYDGQLPGTRLPEQFRRWRVALREFRWQYDNSTARGVIVPRMDGAEYNVVGDLPFPKDPTVSELVFLNRMRPLSQVLDDRGGLVLRHGEPAIRVNLPGVDAFSEATMAWETPSGRLIVSFSRTSDGILGSQRFGMLARNYPVGDLTTNCTVDSRLCVLAADVQSMAPDKDASMYTFAHKVLLDFIQMRETAEHTDGNPDAFKDDLRAALAAYGIPDLGTLVVFAVPARKLTPELTARLRVTAGDASRGEFAGVLDTLRHWSLANPPNDSTYVTGFALLPTPIGEWTVNVVMSDLGRSTGTGGMIAEVPVVGFDGKTLQLSDLVLGDPMSGLAWKHDGVTIPLNPRNAWRPDDTAMLTYQVDGLVRGRPYETHVEIWDARGKPTTYRNSIGFTTAATDTRMTLQRELSLRELPPGDYRVVLRVRDTVTDVEVTRSRSLAVRK